MYYNEILLKERERKGLSQKEMSNLLGIKQQQYARYEKGVNLLPITFLPNISKILDISTDYILGITNTKTPYPRSKTPNKNKTTQDK